MADGKVEIEVILSDGQVAKGVANIDKQLGGVQGSGQKAAFGIGKLVAALGLVALASKGIDMVKSSLDGAISRYDTLNNFPRVLQLMGFDAKESQAAIDKLADGIDGLPTTLDSVAKNTQRIALMTGDLDGAVDTTLALNNAFLASGASTADAERGLEQYVQMLSKGEVDLQSWRTLQETMPIALNETAKAFGFTGKSAQNDLYKALKDGKITFDEFNNKMIELSNKTGGFADIAREASGGIRTAWTNMKTAVVKGVADVIGAIDKALAGTSFGSIEGIINKMKDGIKAAFAAIVAAIPAVVAKIKEVKAALEPWLPLITAIIAGIAGFATTIAVVNTVKNTITALRTAFALLNATILANPIALVVAAIIAAAILIYVYWEPIKEFFINLWNSIKDIGIHMWGLLQEASRNAVEGLTELWGNTKTFFSGLWDSIIGIFQSAFNWLNSITGGAFGAYVGIIQSYMQMVWGVIKDVWNYVKNTFKNVLNFLKVLIKGDFQGMKAAVQAQMQNISGTISNIWNRIKAFFGTALSAILSLVTSRFQGVRNVINSIMNGVRSVISSVWNGIRSVISSVINGIRSVITSGFNAARSIVSSVSNSIRSVVSSVFNGLAGIVRGAMSRVSSAITGGMRGALNAVTNIARSFYNAGRNIVTSIANGIRSAISSVTGAISSVTSRIRDFLPFSPAKEGALRDIMKVRISESIAQAIDKGKPKAIKAMKGLTDNLATDIQPETGLLGNIKGLSANSLIGTILPVEAIQANVTSKENNSNAGVTGLLKEQNQILTKLLQKNQDLYIDGEKVTGVVNTNNAVIAAMTKF